MRRIDYGKQETASTETHLSVDENLRKRSQNAFEEGFAASSGVRPETAETGGRVKNPEKKDSALVESTLDAVADENAGLTES